MKTKLTMGQVQLLIHKCKLSTKKQNLTLYPSIYVQNVENIYALTIALNSLEKTRYELKALSTNEIKIQPLETIHYHNVLRLLKDKSNKYYTFRPKELAQQGHEVINLHNIQRYDSKQPLPLFSSSCTINTSSNRTSIKCALCS